MKKAKLKVSPSGEVYATETEVQKAFVRRIEIVWPKIRPYLFSIPNGAQLAGHVTKKGFPVAASILKAEGMTSGVSDLMLALPRHGYAGLFMETKTIVGTASPEQKAFLKQQTEAGYATVIFRSADEGFEMVRAYLNGEHEQLDLWSDKRFKINK